MNESVEVRRPRSIVATAIVSAVLAVGEGTHLNGARSRNLPSRTLIMPAAEMRPPRKNEEC